MWNFKLFVVIFLITSITLLSGCGASYKYKHVDADGSTCEFSIWSARDVKAADIKISKHCGLTGGADSLSTSVETMKALTSLINKIP